MAYVDLVMELGDVFMGEDNLRYGADLLSTMDGDIETAQSMAQLFFETGCEQVSQIKVALNERRRNELSFSAHKCAGGAAACGFDDLAETLRELELNASSQEWDSLHVEVERVVRTYEVTQERVRAFFTEIQER